MGRKNVKEKRDRELRLEPKFFHYKDKKIPISKMPALRAPMLCEDI